MGLASAETGARIDQLDGFRLVLSPIDLSFCNFAIDFRLGSASAKVRDMIEHLRYYRSRRSFRVFCLTGDIPEDLSDRLLQAGGRVEHSLVQLGVNGSRTLQPTIELRDAESMPERTRLAEFMIKQFFWRQSPSLRRQMIGATVRCPHRLVSHVRAGSNEIIGAAMICETTNAHGLYNLCVSHSQRRGGIGTAIVDAIRREAAIRRVPCVLQCEAGLATWYKNQGFDEVGKIHAISLCAQESFDIMEPRQENTP